MSTTPDDSSHSFQHIASVCQKSTGTVICDCDLCCFTQIIALSLYHFQSPSVGRAAQAAGWLPAAVPQSSQNVKSLGDLNNSFLDLPHFRPKYHEHYHKSAYKIDEFLSEF